jgi:osomolarity two-component system response regulator SKN7
VSVEANPGLQQNGLEAVNKINEDSEHFDLIFMDIIMPQLDGVSATAMIRVNAPNVPIIAMTSNIRQEDITTYFNWGEYNTRHLAVTGMRCSV